MTVGKDPQEIRIKFFQDIVGAVVGKIDATILKNTACRAILVWVVGRRNALLQQLAKDLRSVKSSSTSIRARDHRARGCVTDAGPR